MIRIRLSRLGLVHLDEPPTAVGLGAGDELLAPREVVAVLGQEFDRGQEAVAGQARVGMRAALPFAPQRVVLDRA
jgi:hypothetical protein